MTTAVTTFPALEEQALTWPDIATALLVTDAPSCEAAGGLLRDIKTLRKEIGEFCDPVIEAGLKAHRSALAQKKKLEAPLLSAEKTIDATVGTYIAAERRKQREEEARLAAEQRKADEEARLAEAALLEEAGENEAAEEVIAAPYVAPPPVVQSAVPKMEGVSTRETWSAEVVSLMVLVKAVAEGKAPIAAVEASMTALNGMARAQKGTMQIPGVRAVSKLGMSKRAR